MRICSGTVQTVAGITYKYSFANSNLMKFDMNLDWAIDPIDAAIQAICYQNIRNGKPCIQSLLADVNRDRKLDLADLDLMRGQLRQSKCTPSIVYTCSRKTRLLSTFDFTTRTSTYPKGCSSEKDFNNDGLVTEKDYALVLQAVNTNASPVFDINYDGVVDRADAASVYQCLVNSKCTG